MLCVCVLVHAIAQNLLSGGLETSGQRVYRNIAIPLNVFISDSDT